MEKEKSAHVSHERKKKIATEGMIGASSYYAYTLHIINNIFTIYRQWRFSSDLKQLCCTTVDFMHCHDI